MRLAISTCRRCRQSPYAHGEARVHFARALEALAQLPDGDETPRRRVDTTVKQVSVSLIADGPVAEPGATA